MLFQCSVCYLCMTSLEVKYLQTNFPLRSSPPLHITATKENPPKPACELSHKTSVPRSARVSKPPSPDLSPHYLLRPNTHLRCHHGVAIVLRDIIHLNLPPKVTPFGLMHRQRLASHALCLRPPARKTGPMHLGLMQIALKVLKRIAVVVETADSTTIVQLVVHTEAIGVDDAHESILLRDGV